MRQQALPWAADGGRERRQRQRTERGIGVLSRRCRARTEGGIAQLQWIEAARPIALYGTPIQLNERVCVCVRCGLA